MALFGISRFDASSDAPNASSSPSDILAKLHKQASERKQSRQGKQSSESPASKQDVKRKLEEESDLVSPAKKKKKDNNTKVSTKNKKQKRRDSTSSDEESDAHLPSSDEQISEETSQLENASFLDTTDTSVVEKQDEILNDNEEGGFTIIGDVKKEKSKEVRRVLPDWLAAPSIVSADIRTDKVSIQEDNCGLEDDIVVRLKEEGITHLFPVQSQVIPALLSSCSTGLWSGAAGYRPSDVCCSAPTGSGKTLAFVLPIVQALRRRHVCAVRALAVLPVGDLAIQVYKVFSTYCQGTPLKVGLLIGQKAFSTEQHSVVKKGARGYESLVDIIIATPGRLVDHINQTPGFSLKYLRFLVIDEADRMMEEIKQDWLGQVEKAVYAARGEPGTALTVASAAKMEMPLQKLLFSATLSQNPEKLQQLKLFQPKLFTSVVSSGQKETETETGSNQDYDNKGEFVGKFTTPKGLSEYYVESDVGQKPLVVLYLLHHLKFKRILCFTNSVEATHRLFWLVKLVGGCNVQEFSSNLHVQKRKRMLKQFSEGKIDMLICSDAMARGMDVDNVQYVVSYEAPPYVKTYIHRVGRTARAGRVGTAVTLLEKKEIFHFKKMCRQAGKCTLKELNVKKGDLRPFVDAFNDALQKLPDILKQEKHKK